MNEEPTTLKFAFHGQFTIVKACFDLLYCYDKDQSSSDQIIQAAWIHSDHSELQLSALADYFKIPVPEFVNTLALESVALSYRSGAVQEGKFDVKSNRGGLELSLTEESGLRSYSFSILFKDLQFNFSDLPFVGHLIQGENYFRIKKVTFTYRPAKAGESNQYVFDIDWSLIVENKVVFPLNSFAVNDRLDVSNEQKALTQANHPESIKWIEIHKSFKVLHFDQLGFSFDGNEITVLLNAGFSILALEIDFYGLYFSIPLAPEKSFDFGLNGLMVSFNKPPLILSGGLYHIIDPRYKNLFNGEVMVRVGEYGFTALGSFCEDAAGNPSFFLYLMVSLPIGGPPYFFVKGFALGMGVNRGIKLPDIKQLESFPFVAAVIASEGKKSEKEVLKPESSMSDVLTELSEWIYPSKGEFFFTAGIKFCSFGLLNCFGLINVEFGHKIQLSLMGFAEVSLPPNCATAGQNPIAFARLLILVAFDSEEGFLEVLGTLSQDSYILDKKCRLTGGFAACVWFNDARLGDFFVSLGGCHHPLFINKDSAGNQLYPDLDKVGINWEINSNIKLVGSGYFALTPSCMMAGAAISITFEAGNLKAWFAATADFILKWKPFFYSASVSIRVGASYTIKIFGIHKTFKVELGAGLDLWGPEFSGTVHISWFIISFSISFGNGSRSPKHVEWGDFSDSFLAHGVEITKKLQANNVGLQVFSFQTKQGLLANKKVNGEEVPCVAGDFAEFSLVSIMPCTTLSQKTNSKLICLHQYSGLLGVVPMKLENYTSEIQLTIFCGETIINSDSLKIDVLENSFPPALWSPKETNINDHASIVAPAGFTLTALKNKIENMLPAQGSYQMQDLLARQPIAKTVVQTIVPLPSAKDYSKISKEDIFAQIQKSLPEKNIRRQEVLHALGEKAGIRNPIFIGKIGETPEKYLLAYPRLKTTGA